MDMWLSSKNLSSWIVSSHKNWGENTSSKSILQVLNQKIAKYEKGFWRSIIVPQTNTGECVPIWWSSIFSDKMDLFLQCDFDHPIIQKFYQNVDKNYNIFIENLKFKERYRATKLPISEELFCRLFAYTWVFNKMFIRKEENFYLDRLKHYDKGKIPLLSEILEKRVFMCAEQALLAHHYLKIHGIDSSYVWGELLTKLPEENGDFAEAHSFIYLKDNDIQFIYDPTLPTKSWTTLFPKIQKNLNYSDFLELFRMAEKQFIAVEDLCNDSKFYYGFWDWTWISPENILLWSESKQQNKD